MAVKRKTYTFRKGDVIEVEEFHDGNYGAPGSRRGSRRKATAEQMALVNRYNKAKRCRHRLLQYFNSGDLFATLTYEKTNRPADMDAAKKDFRKAMRSVRKEHFVSFIVIKRSVYITDRVIRKVIFSVLFYYIRRKKFIIAFCPVCI